MHQDQRIGLALGVLLLGAAGAFFFRNDPHPAQPGARLNSARELDAKIAEKSLSPYLQSLEDEDHPSTFGSGRRGSHDTVRDDVGDLGSHLPSLEDLGFSSTVDSRAMDLGKGGASNGSQPDAGSDSMQNRTPIPLDDDEEIVSGRGVSRGTGAAASTVSARVHVVQKGESLSSIAAKELGDANRFLEIFEANRDQLKNANDVKIGMSLQIPVRRSGRDGSTTSNSAPRSNYYAPPLLPSESSRRDVGDLSPIPTNSSSDSPIVGTETQPPVKGKFEPAKRLPLGVQGFENSTNSPRKLTQVPPKDADGKVAR